MKLLKHTGRVSPVLLSRRLRLALRYAARGWSVFPCWWVEDGKCSCGDLDCRRSGKHPLTANGYKDATVDPATIRQWWMKNPQANIGIATGPSGLVVLDVDPEHGGDESLEAWKPSPDDLATYMVRTGRGGRHYYFMRAESFPTRLSLRPGIDILADTGYVIAAGSSGLRMPYVCEQDVQVRGIPPWLRDAMQESKSRGPEREPVADNWVATALLGVHQGQRNATCTRLAGHFLGNGTPPEAVRLILHDYGSRCCPELEQSEVDGVVKSIAASESSNSDRPAEPLGEPLPIFGARVRAQPERPMLIELLIPAYGITLFHGQPRAGKSLALLECLLAVATGTPAFSVEGLAVPRAAPVLYITEEDPEVEVWKRLDAMCRGRGLTGPPESFFLSVGKRLWIDDPKWQARIIESVRRNRIQVVAVDPLRSVTAHADQGPAELNPVQRFLRRLMGETGCSVWLCHHDTKPPARGLDSRPLPQRASGGGVFSLSDSPIHVRVAGERPFRSVLTPKSYKFLTTPDPVAFMLTTTDDGGWLLAGTRDQVESAEDIEHDEEDLILRFLADHPESSRNAVREGIQKNKEKTLERLRRLEADHRIESVGAGRRTTLRLIEPGDHPVNGSDGSRTVPEPQPPVGSTVPLPIGREPRTVLGPNGRIVWLNRPSPSLRRTP